jgi:isoleucyl-tRNA synthetase
MPEFRLTLFAVVSSLTHFASVTLSSFYFDIKKDCLYADLPQGDARRVVVAILWEVH